MQDEIVALPWVDPEHRYYVIGRLLRRADVDGDREALKCVTCHGEMKVFYPSLTYVGFPYLAVCIRCGTEIRGKRAVELWNQTL